MNNLNEPLWFARQVENREEWEGTGNNQWAINVFVDFKAALSFFLSFYPQTDVIQGTMNGFYRVAFPNRAPAITILDAIAKELGQ